MTTVYQVVAPLKEDAIVKAAEQAEIIAERVYTKLAGCDWDIHVAFPYPTNCWDRDYKSQKAQHHLASSLIRGDKARPYSGRIHDPYYVVRNDEALKYFIETAKKNAAQQYDLFALKLAGKIGDHIDAELEGNHVWSESILTVTKPDGSKHRWKTKTIINVSKLGTLFNQWPTRKIK